MLMAASYTRHGLTRRSRKSTDLKKHLISLSTLHRTGVKLSWDQRYELEDAKDLTIKPEIPTNFGMISYQHVLSEEKY